jgi:hypothetical protein
MKKLPLLKEAERNEYELYLPAPRCASRQAGGLTDEEIKIVEGETK